MARVIKLKNREEWLIVRSGGVGSSDVATILGLNPYDSPYMLYKRKRGEEPPKETTTLMELGHSLEWAIADYFGRTTGRKIVGASAGDWLYQDEEYPYLMASPDRTYWLDDNGVKGGKLAHSNQAILECKSTQKRIDPENIPPYWFCQLQWQLGIGGLESGSIAWLTAGRDFGYVDVAFNPEFFQMMKDEAIHFWRDCVAAGKEPQITTNTDVLAKFFESKDGKSLKADSLLEAKVEQLHSLKAQIKALEEQQEGLELDIKAAMEDAEALLGAEGDILVTWRTTAASRTLDTKALRAAHPEICEEFMKERAGSRRFVLK